MSDEQGDRPRTPPIEPPGFTHGVTVIDFGDLRVARGLTRRPFSGCEHLDIRYDQHERRIWCTDCETDVEPFDAFKMLVERFDAKQKQVQRQLDEAHEASKFSLISRAAKTIDRRWRSRNSVPSCPHCHAGIWPEDALKMGSVGKEYDAARRKREAALANQQPVQE